MESRMVKFYSKESNMVAIHAIPGHFATSHSHINYYIDITSLKTRIREAKEVARVIDQLFDLRPKAIEERLKLRNPIYQETAAYGHMGREPQVVSKTFFSRYEGNKTVEVELFTWEKLDYVDKIKAAFGL